MYTRFSLAGSINLKFHSKNELGLDHFLADLEEIIREVLVESRDFLKTKFINEVSNIFLRSSF